LGGDRAAAFPTLACVRCIDADAEPKDLVG
jgi:hypothetical protein